MLPVGLFGPEPIRQPCGANYGFTSSKSICRLIPYSLESCRSRISDKLTKMVSSRFSVSNLVSILLFRTLETALIYFSSSNLIVSVGKSKEQIELGFKLFFS